MHPTKMFKSKKRIIYGLLFCFILMTITVLDGPAQEKSAKVTKGSKKSESIWKLQAQGVSKNLGLTKEKSSALERAYIAARHSYAAALKNLPEEKDRQKARAASELVIKSEREKFRISLKKIISAAQIKLVVPLLGSFNKNWDTYLTALQAFGLTKENMIAAQKLLNEYVVEYEKAREKAVASEGRFSKKNSQVYKDKLDSGLSKILTPDQLLQWNATTTKGKSAASAKGAKSESEKEKKGNQAKEE